MVMIDDFLIMTINHMHIMLFKNNALIDDDD